MARYAIGIDLGTTHSALARVGITGEQGASKPEMLQIPQLVQPGVVEERALLPSFLYLPNENEFAAETIAVPWESAPRRIVGEFARAHGAKVPARLVSSAKSWLCHAGVDRLADILPWEAPPDVPRLSPLEASTCYLQHLKAAWDHQHPEAPLAEQEVVLTVPASFDASARELTQQAAERAGLGKLVLLEEPQAAFYAWLEAMGERFRKEISVGDVILVVDLGGGTTDLSLISVSDEGGDLQLTRLAVGDHILLGGDNMDLALAYNLNQQLSEAGKKLDAWQFNSLVYGCREAKEKLFANSRLEKAAISIPSRGSALVGGTIRTELRREMLEQVLTEGFFPRTAVEELPRSARRTGLAQMALPYAQDPAVTRHLAAFLSRQAKALSGEAKVQLQGKNFVHPTAVLFNGGVFKAGPLKERVLEVLNQWLERDGGAPARELPGSDLDLAVARGAAYYGWVRQGHGIRIRGGTARAYYIGIESAVPAVPGFEPPLKALCVAPFGMEEGTQAEIPPQEFGLVVGEPASFRFFASSTRREDRPGDLIDHASQSSEFEEVAPIETTLTAEQAEPGKLIPVNLQAEVTELGTLELRCLQRGGPGQWKLELNVRMKE